MTTQECAKAIVLGTYRPWETRSDIATPDQWRFYAQCAIDGDEADLDICLDYLDEALS